MIYARGMWVCNKQNEYLKIVTVQVVANIGLNFILIPPLGIMGAALATLSAELIGFPFYYHEFRKIAPAIYVSLSLGPCLLLL